MFVLHTVFALVVVLLSLLFPGEAPSFLPATGATRRLKPIRAANKRGWTERGRIWTTLSKYIPSHRWGYPNTGNIRYFSGLTAEDLIVLSQLVPEGELEGTQNDAPSFGGFATFAEQFPRVTFHGYMIDKTRDDERISIEGCMIPVDIYAKARSVLSNYWGSPADEEDFADESETTMRLWWD